ncbi:MAG: sulfotransferase [Paracoccaceae bacterium]
MAGLRRDDAGDKRPDMKPAPDLLSRLSGRTMILGVGAQKAGTSWLFDYLAADPAVYASPIKELNFFNSWLRPNIGGRANDHYREKMIFASRLWRRSVDPASFRLMRERVAMIDDRDAYLRYFGRRVEDETHLLEITPSYSILRGRDFRDLRRYFNAAGITVKPVFLMRDPVDRYYSQLRMRQADSRGAFVAKDNFLACLNRVPATSHGAYHQTVTALWRAFGKDAVGIAFYENIFADPDTHLRRLTDFLGLEWRAPDTGRRINTSPRPTKLESAEISAALDRFADVYSFVNAHFGAAKPASWRA